MTAVSYFDIHSHLTDAQFAEDRESVILRMKEKGVGTITIGTDVQTSQEAVALATEHEHVWACIGVHPEDGIAGGFPEQEFTALAQSDKVVAVGECGLDYFRVPKKEVYETQRELFEAQIQFALTHDLPLMLHMRPTKHSLDAYEDALSILERYKKEYGETLRGNSHFFAGDTEIAKRLFDIDFTISFTGVITFASDYDEVLRFSPIEHIHAETDAPYVAPVPHRRKRNEPVYVEHIVSRIAEIKNIPLEVCATKLRENVKNLFGV